MSPILCKVTIDNDEYYYKIYMIKSMISKTVLNVKEKNKRTGS